MFNELLKHDRARLRRKGFDPEDEDSLIRALGCEDDRYTVLAATEMLRAGHGTKKCVPALKAACSHRSQDVQATAMYLIERFAGASELPFYREMLADSRYREKYAALNAVAIHGDQSDIPVMSKRARQLLARQHGVIWGDFRAEPAVAFLFLEQFAGESAEAARTLAWARGRLHVLEESERENMLRAVPSMNESRRRRVLVVRPRLDDAGRLFYGIVHGLPSFAASEIVVPHRFAARNVRRLLAISDYTITIGADAHRLVDELDGDGTVRRLRLDVPRYVGGKFETFVAMIDAMRKEDAETVGAIRAAMARGGVDPGSG